MESLIMIRLLIRDSKVIVKTNVIGMKPQDMTSSAGRLVWLDWMKALAILSIVWGHFFSEGHLYLYVFSVQVFCVISGFLYKKSPDWRTCLTKCFWSAVGCCRVDDEAARQQRVDHLGCRQRECQTAIVEGRLALLTSCEGHEGHQEECYLFHKNNGCIVENSLQS